MSGGISEGSTPEVGIHPDLIDLDKAISHVLDTPLSGLGVAQLVERTTEVQRLRSRLDAVLGQHLLSATKTAALTPSYVGVPATEVAAGSHTNPRPLGDAVLVNRWLDEFPTFAEAHRDGLLSTEHLRRLRSVDRSHLHRQLLESQELLVDIARTLDWADFERALAHWVNAADPDGLQPRDDLRNRPTGLSHKTNADGSVDGRFHLDPLAAQVFNSAVGSETEKLFKQSLEPESVETVDKPERKSPYQLAGQALLNLIIRGHQHPEGSPLVPLVDLVIGHELAQNLLEQLRDQTVEPVAPSTTDPDRWCHFLDGTPVHPVHAAVLLSIGRIRSIILDEHRQVRAVVSKSRSFPPWMRHLLLIESKGRCSTPGCDAPFPWLQADHIKPASRGGPTCLDNGQTLCGPENRRKGDREPEAD